MTHRCGLAPMVAFIWTLLSTSLAAAEPVLRTDPGMHLTAVEQLVADRAGAYLATSAGSESVRIWDGPADTGAARVVQPQSASSDRAESGWEDAGCGARRRFRKCVRAKRVHPADSLAAKADASAHCWP